MSIKDRNATRVARMTERLRSSAQAGAPPVERPETSVADRAETMGSLNVSEHPALAHTQELTRDAVQSLRAELAKASARNVELETAAAQMTETRTRPALLDPKTIRQSRFRDRVEQAFHDKAFEQLKREISSTGGNVEAIKVRPIADPDFTYEVVYGHRRHQACLSLGLPVKAEIESLDQRQMLLQMWAENQAREDLSLFEQSLSMQRMLDEGVFANRSALGSHMNLTRSNLSKLLAISDVADLASAILKDPRDLTSRIATNLRARANEKSPVIDEMVAMAKAKGKLSMSQVRKMLSPAPARSESFTFSGDEGALIDGQMHNDSATLTIHKRLDKDQLEKLAAFVRSL